jgi:hypothetical protein
MSGILITVVSSDRGFIEELDTKASTQLIPTVRALLVKDDRYATDAFRHVEIEGGQQQLFVCMRDNNTNASQDVLFACICTQQVCIIFVVNDLEP